jgi:hypothetical protein
MDAKINVGDTVAYTATYLLTSGLFIGDLDRATGRVIALNPDQTYAEVAWDQLSSTVRVDSLEPVSRPAAES